MKLEYRELEKEDVLVAEQRNEIIEKINNNLIPNKKELKLLLDFERKYRICGGCKKSVTENIMIAIATIEIKGKTINIGYFEKCLSCEMKSNLFGL